MVKTESLACLGTWLLEVTQGLPFSLALGVELALEWG